MREEDGAIVAICHLNVMKSGRTKEGDDLSAMYGYVGISKN